MDLREVLKVNDVIYTEYGGAPIFLYIDEVAEYRFGYIYISDRGKIQANYQDDIALDLWLSKEYKGKIHRGSKAIKIAKLMGLIP